jgi:hypothetical protein
MVPKEAGKRLLGCMAGFIAKGEEGSCIQSMGFIIYNVG